MTEQSTTVPQTNAYGEPVPHVAGIIPFVPQEVDELSRQLAQVASGELAEGSFRAFRLLRGVYGQRQPERQMVRIKIPLGRLRADQLLALADAIRDFAPLGKGHFTTRENLQLHHVAMDRVPALLARLGAAGLTTREACGNTVRNLTGCPLAGVCADELFDATPYGAAYARYFVRRDLVQQLPRKFKTAFAGCREDHALVRMHDLGFSAVVRREPDGLVRGFRVAVGGGTSIEPLIAPVLFDFVGADDGAYLRVAEAVLRIFNRSDELRRNRMRARIKVLVKRIGIDAFREQVEAELAEPWTREPLPMDELLAVSPSDADGPAAAPAPPLSGAVDGPEAFRAWAGTNVVAQRQAGYVAAFVTLPAGDISAEQCLAVAELARRFGSGEVRATPDQNLALRWVPVGAAPQLWRGLALAGLDEAGARGITDIVSCPGTDSCKLGITSSMGLNRAIRARLLAEPELLRDPLIERLRIKASGCPNGCGQHHVADIGFHGAAARGDQNVYVPSYEVFVAGEYAADQVRYGQRLKTKVPARTVPALVIAFLTLYRERRLPGESLPAFVGRLGKEPFEALAKRCAVVPALDPAEPGPYQDWERQGLYRLERGEGECAS